MKNRTLTIAIAILLAGAVITLVSFSTIESKARKVVAINITVLDQHNSLFLTPIRVRTHLDTYGPLVGILENNLPLGDLYDHIMLIPSVSTVSIYPSLSGELNFILTQKKPRVRVHPEQGPDFYIDDEGLAMPLDPVHSARVPIIHAVDINEAVIGVDLLDSMGDDRFWSSLIDQIIIEPSGEITILPRLGAPVFLGTAQDTEEQKRNLITFYREQIKTGNLKNYTQIDLSYRDQVIATRYAHIN
jgi:cell division protein FtsQ